MHDSRWQWHGRPLKANLCSGLLACFLINSSLPSPSWGTKECVSGSAGGDGDCSSADRHACSIRGSTAGFRKSIRSAAKKGASSIPRFAIEPGIITDALASVPLPLAFLGSCARPVVRHAAFYKGLYFALCAFPRFSADPLAIARSIKSVKSCSTSCAERRACSPSAFARIASRSSTADRLREQHASIRLGSPARTV